MVDVDQVAVEVEVLVAAHLHGSVGGRGLLYRTAERQIWQRARTGQQSLWIRTWW